MTQAITVTETARNRLKELIANKPDALGVILEIKSGGCAGYKFQFDYLLHQEQVDSPEYTLLHYDDFTIAVFNQSCSLIEGLDLDYIQDNFGSKFVFNNTKNQCGCGKSFNI
jgi:iron-sulfur cluster assembly protein